MAPRPISKVRRNICLLLMVLLILSWGYFVLSFARDYRTLREQSGRDLQSQAFRLEAHTGQVLELIDSLLLEMVGHYRHQPEHDMKTLFSGWLLRFPAFSSLAIIDVDSGEIVFRLGHNENPDPFVANAAIAFSGGNNHLQLADQLFTGSNSRQLIAISRSFEHHSQKMRVVALLYVDFFLKFHQRQEKTGDDSISVYHQNGLLLARWPARGDLVGRSFAATTFFQRILTSAETGLLEESRSPGGHHQLVAYRKLSKIPLVITVETSINAIFYAWQKRFLSYLTFQLLVSVGIIASLILQSRALSRVEKVEVDLEEREEHFRAVADSSVDAVISVNAAERVRFWSVGAEQTFGCPRDEALDTPISCFLQFVENDRPLTLKQLAGDNSPWATGHTLEVQGQRKDGQLFPTELSLSHGTVSGRSLYTLIVRDITERRQMEERARRMASHDGLTGLPNRALMIDRLQVAMAQVRRQGGQFALLFVDLDQFKPVNDTFGHEAGDRLLQQVAKRMQATVRESDTVARIGGDEFAVLLQNAESEAAVRQACDHLLMSLRKKFYINSKLVMISCSIGAVLYHGQDRTAGDLIGLADNAMYAAKRAGKNRFAFAQE